MLSVVVSPYVRSISLIGDRAAFLMQYHLETKSLYSAVVGKESEEKIDDEEVARAGRVLARLMSLIAKATKSRYYSYTGPLQVEERRLVFRPYISPTSTARIYIEGNRIVADAGDVFKKKIRTKTDVEKALRTILSKVHNA
ncbi:hypothetical protein [Thermoproteus uzoniensis]|uniref:hypothetical protein n=1 Tax=Thermoproteus uzoniensis TaxID=184117 RepID=UPI001F225689|nr:hypothetical protein [Thermoproteus uzoniensis]